MTPIKAKFTRLLHSGFVKNEGVSDVLPARRIIQWITTVVVVLIGVRFTMWVVPHLGGRWPEVSRPPGVEAFLPIDGMLATRHLLLSGVVDSIHPAGLAIFLGICLMSVVVAKSFCSHLCPVGLMSELLGRLGIRLVGKNLVLPKWLDIPLRSLKFLLLGFFIWAVWFTMDGADVAAFLSSPYNKVVGAKMWLFFAEPTRLTLSVLGVLVVGSVFIRDLWCRYLCPYGALLGVMGLFAPLKVTRDADKCTDCHGCTRACPAQLPVHGMARVRSIECTSCQDCVVACPVEGCLAVRPPTRVWRDRWLRPVTAALVAVVLYLGVVAGFRAAGHWHTSVTETEFHERLQNLDGPGYGHPGR